MGGFGILRTAIFLALAAITFGRPTSDYNVHSEEIKIFREQVAMLREIRPCYARLLEVKADIKQFDEIKGDPHYVPECDEEGIKWRPAQCDHHSEGACFCVHEENGEVLEHSRDLKLNKEALGCGRRAENPDHSGHECFHMRDEFTHMQNEYGLAGHSPLPYYPECSRNGKFMAMQRNDRSEFFCVSMDTGKIIPDTETEAGEVPPLTEYICQAYDEVWKEFKQWNSSHDVELHKKEVVINESSCGYGFTFTECGCPLICTHKTTLESITSDSCVCAPACICPNGMLELDGRCISLEECNEAKPKSKVPQADKLDDLTAGDYSRWREFKQGNPNAVLMAYNTIGMEEVMYAAGPVAYDVNPNGRAIRVEPPPEEEAPVEGKGHFGFLRGEPIPRTGEGQPILRQVLTEGGPSPDEVERAHEAESYPVEEETEEEEEESSEEEEQENFSFPLEEEEYHPIEENRGEEIRESFTTEEPEYPREESEFSQEEEFVEHQEEGFHPEVEEPVEHQEEGYFPEEEEPVQHQEDGYYPEEEEVEQNQEEMYSPHEEEVVENREEEFYPEEERNELPAPQEEQENPQEEEERFPGEEEHENIQPYEEENFLPAEEEFENIQPHEEENLPEEYQPEEEEPENEETEEPEDEIDERLIKEELSDHQSAFSSVPKPEHDAEEEHQTSPPCEENEQESNLPLENTEKEENEQEESLAEVDRVLIENGIIQPSPIEATFEKPTPSIKKNRLG